MNFLLFIDRYCFEKHLMRGGCGSGDNLDIRYCRSFTKFHNRASKPVKFGSAYTGVCIHWGLPTGVCIWVVCFQGASAYRGVCILGVLGWADSAEIRKAGGTHPTGVLSSFCSILPLLTLSGSSYFCPSETKVSQRV